MVRLLLKDQGVHHLPGKHVCTSILPMTIDPLSEHVPNHSFRSGTNDERIFQFSFRVSNQSTFSGSQSVMCHDGTLLGKSVHVFGFFRQKGFGNQQRKVRIFGSMILNLIIQLSSHAIPNGHAPRFNDHTSTHWRRFGEARDANQIIVPLGVVGRTRRNEIGFGIVVLLLLLLFVLLLLLRFLFLFLLLLLFGSRGRYRYSCGKQCPEVEISICSMRQLSTLDTLGTGVGRAATNTPLGECNGDKRTL